MTHKTHFSAACSQTKVLALAMLLGSFVPFVGCAKTENSNGAKTEFAMFGQPAQASLVETYRTLRESSDVVVCVGHVGYSHTSPKGVQRTEWARRAVVAWITALQESPDWPNKKQKNFDVTAQTGVCPNALVHGSPGFKIMFFGTAQDQVNATCGPDSPQAEDLRSYGLCQESPLYSFASPSDRTAIISVRMGNQSRSEAFLFETVLHEFGHILGLGDLYKSLSINYEGAIPSSIMAYSAETLTADDKLGIWNIEKATRTGDWDCGGYATARNLNASNGYTYCRPSSAALANASRAHAQMSATQERNALVGKRVKVILRQNTTLKTSDADSKSLGADSKCGLAGAQDVAGTFLGTNASGNHVRIAFDTPLGTCPSSLAQGGYFFEPHVKISEAMPSTP
jgi:hypothetical protein